MILHAIGEALRKKGQTIKGTVVLMRKNFLDCYDLGAKLQEDLSEVFGKRITLQLISATVPDPNNGDRGKVGEVANIEGWGTILTSLAVAESRFEVDFQWDEDFGIPGAIIVNNYHPTEFFLKTITLEDVPGKGRVVFLCNSWVYPEATYKHNRIFFTNDTYLPKDTPLPLQPFRQDELINLRGDHVTGELKEHHRVYGYAYYNDLAVPEQGQHRPVLGGSKEYPYPRRGRTGRQPTLADPKTESRLSALSSLNIYVPRDERFGHLKMSDFLGNSLKSVLQGIVPGLQGLLFNKDFNTYQDVLDLYYKGIPLPQIPGLGDTIPFELIKDLVAPDGARLFKMPVPQVIKEDVNAWKTDEEFAREMLAGLNPVIIQRLREFPPTSNLDPNAYGNHTSSITEAHLLINLEGLTVNQALENNKLFILDHHDALIPYLNRINTNTNNRIYATRTILFLKDDGTLKPIAIELSLVHPDGEQHGSIDKVYTPADSGLEKAIWQLAKTYAVVSDHGVHGLISHWLRTHAVTEPFVIATNRNLSVYHPVHKLLSPHFRDTMTINALARQILISAGGVLETTNFPDQYSMELSSHVYKGWKLTDEALPDDLIRRGMAVEDTSKPHNHNLRFLIPDYPFAVDGLAIWTAIETWVSEYCSIYYPNDATLTEDTELQSWWKEVREVAHGDKKDETWWPEMNTVSSLTKTVTTIIWIASALHAAVNFGQYPYAGYIPNRPTLTRRFMPESGSKEYEELKTNPDKVLLNTITGQFHTVLGVALIEILSKHASDEVYIGQRDSPEWTTDQKALEAFYRFRNTLVEIEKGIEALNNDKSLKNRYGPVRVPYTLLYPNTSDVSGASGLTGKGVPNSISI
nr:lipoxygenase 4 [Tulipa gesneriana]